MFKYIRAHIHTYTYVHVYLHGMTWHDIAIHMTLHACTDMQKTHVSMKAHIYIYTYIYT